MGRWMSRRIRTAGPDAFDRAPRIGPVRRIARAAGTGGTEPRREDPPTMRKLLTALFFLGATLALAEGCAPVPLPHYAAFQPKRVNELLVDSENLRMAGDEWERFW